MRHGAVIVLVVLVSLAAGCRGAAPTATPTRVPTASVMPTATDTATPTATPLPTPTTTPVPVWRILFHGFSCEGREMCAPFDDTQFHYYSINSDGTGLEQLQIPSFSPTPSLPEGAYHNYLSPPQLSPDGFLLTYVGEDGLYSECTKR